MGEWIYYENSIQTTNGEEETTYTDGIYKLKNDGSIDTKICSDYAENIIVVGDWIYYVNYSDCHKLYKIKVDGTQRTKINDDNYCGYLNISGDWIYYSKDISVSADGKTKRELYKIKFDGTEKTKIPCDDYFSFILVDGDYAYYLSPTSNNSQAIFRMKKDGTESTKLKDVSIYTHLLNVSSGDIYFNDYVPNGQPRTTSSLHKLSSNGQVSNTLSDPVNIEDFWLVDNRIYFNITNTVQPSTSTNYRMDTDGNNLKTISTIKYDN